MSQLSPLEQIIWNEGERLIPGVSHNYMEVRRHYSSYIFFRQAIELDLAMAHVHPPVRIADLGCGVGHGCATLATIRGAHVLGVDVSAESIQYARQHYDRPNITWRKQDLSSFLSGDAEFEYVVSRGVLEHIPDGLKMVQECRWLCRLMFDVPYDEAAGGNPHHVLNDIRESAFDSFEMAELFYQDLGGRMYARQQKPEHVNVIMCCCRQQGSRQLTDSLPLPSCPDWHHVGPLARPDQPERSASELAVWLEQLAEEEELIRQSQPPAEPWWRSLYHRILRR